MPYCGSCGAPLSGGERFCPGCGRPAESARPPEGAGPSQPPASGPHSAAVGDATAGAMGGATAGAGGAPAGDVGALPPPLPAPRGGRGGRAPAPGGRRAWVSIAITIAACAVGFGAAYAGYALTRGGGGAGPIVTASPTAIPTPSETPTPSPPETSTPSPSQTPTPIDTTTTGTNDGLIATPFWAAFFHAAADYDSARAEADKLEALGFTNVLVLSTADYTGLQQPGENLWVDCVGPYPTEDDARAALVGLQGSGWTDADVKYVP